VHRDFTPHNLLLPPSGQLKLIDFNAALHAYRKPGEKDDVIGKPYYIPPEQFRGRATIQSDIYALGATLYFLLTGEEPNPISESHPKQIKPDLSDAIDRIVGRATRLNVAARYQDADELLADLLADIVL
jgi:serine/threonine-protein kinase